MILIKAVQLITFLIMITVLSPNDHKNRYIEKTNYMARHYILQVNSYFVLCSE